MAHASHREPQCEPDQMRNQSGGRSTVVVELVDRMPEPTAKEPVKNYITPSGLQRLRDELRFLLTRYRPAVTQVVA